MRKVILIMLLAFVSSNAMAEWKNVFKNDSSSIYIEFSTVRRAGDMVKFWQLIDYKAAQNMDKISYSSIRSLNQIDCKEERKKVLYGTFHSGNMANGNLIYIISEPLDWEPIPPGTLYSVLFKSFCNKK